MGNRMVEHSPQILTSEEKATTAVLQKRNIVGACR